MAIVDVVSRTRVAISQDVYAEAVTPGSPDHEEARRLQAERFAKVSTRETSEASYVEVTDNPWRYSIPIVVKRVNRLASTGEQNVERIARSSERIIGTARLDLRGGMLIESMIRLTPDSLSQQALSNGKVGEISTFATSPEVDKATIVDIIDAIIGVITRLASDLALDWLWIFPRNGFMSILWATIPGAVPGYQFTLNPDVAGWNEESERLQQFRALRLRGLGVFPEIYQIAAHELEANLRARLALLPERERYRPQMDRILLRAMWQARKEHATPSQHLQQAADRFSSAAEVMTDKEREKIANSQHGQSFLPFAPSSDGAASYLHAVLQQGGQAAVEYKQKSHQL
ncbi:MAG TPA: hypothetical protein VKQ36_05860, partial [Ktedonobacterales bacterium]|nr:hypothetical protein [Ktedonobacterales bacterium]